MKPDRRSLVRAELIALRASVKEAIDGLEKLCNDPDKAITQATWAMGKCRFNLEEIKG